MKTFGSQPHPRALIWGFDDGQVARIAPVFATTRSIESLNDAEQSEWDVLVTRRGCVGANPHLFVLAFEGDFDAEALKFGLVEGGQGLVWYLGDSRATEFQVPSGLDPAIESQVTERLAGRAVEIGTHRVLYVGNLPCQGDSPIRPFLIAIDGRYIAGAFRRSGGQAECWCLPAHAAADAHLWAEAAVAVWSGQDINRFPNRNSVWPHAPQWRTPAEAAILEAVGQITQERQRMLDGFDAELVRQNEQLASATELADLGRRVLLTGQGDELCEQVARGLEDLGFEVERMDPKWPAGDKREDLHIRELNYPAWVAIAEIRGYRKGRTADGPHAP
jgi:hypothetical protein